MIFYIIFDVLIFGLYSIRPISVLCLLPRFYNSSAYFASVLPNVISKYLFLSSILIYQSPVSFYFDVSQNPTKKSTWISSWLISRLTYILINMTLEQLTALCVLVSYTHWSWWLQLLIWLCIVYVLLMIPLSKILCLFQSDMVS